MPWNLQQMPFSLGSTMTFQTSGMVLCQHGDNHCESIANPSTKVAHPLPPGTAVAAAQALVEALGDVAVAPTCPARTPPGDGTMKSHNFSWGNGGKWRKMMEHDRKGGKMMENDGTWYRQWWEMMEDDGKWWNMMENDEKWRKMTEHHGT